jgi:hypothetical protein
MFEKQASATTSNLVMFTAAMLLLLGQPAGYSAGLDGGLGAWSGGEPSAMCRMPVGLSETYGQTFSRMVYETETALLMPFDAPDCAA